MAVVGVINHTLIDICMTKNMNSVEVLIHKLFHYTAGHFYLLVNFTCAGESIAFKAFFTCAVEATLCISAVSIGMAWIHF